MKLTAKIALFLTHPASRDFLFGCAVTLVGLVLWMLLLETVFRLGGVFGVVLSALAYSAAVTAVLVTGRRDG